MTTFILVVLAALAGLVAGGIYPQTSAYVLGKIKGFFKK